MQEPTAVLLIMVICQITLLWVAVYGKAAHYLHILFIIAAEVLAISIRSNEEIKGIVIGDKEYKIKQFADDSQTMSIYERNSINATIKNFLDYGKVSGSTINYDKSADILRIGSIKNTHISIGKSS